MLKSRVEYSKASFITSAPDITKLPADSGVEVAFAGRSNAGKSSALNTLTDQKLARTSKTPGRTQLINTFSLGETMRIIDLPGYGYAKVPLDMKNKWQKSLGEYLQKRESLKGIVVLMDIRHPLKELDMDLINWAVESDLEILALLTKADKFKQGKRKSEVLKVRRELATLSDKITVHAFSSLKGIGLSELSKTLDNWYLGELTHIDPELAVEDEPSNEVD